MKKARGYVFSRNFHGSRVPQHIQNVVIRNFCKINNLEYLLSASEYSMKDSYHILKTTIKELKDIDGIVFYSLFQLPSDSDLRAYFYKQILRYKKRLYFAVENIVIKTNLDLIRIENILNIQSLLTSALSKEKLNSYFINKY